MDRTNNKKVVSNIKKTNLYVNVGDNFVDGNKHNFQKLTPINTANIEIYEDAIDFVFNNNDLKNVALSGAYSAGKSSVLESYKTKHKDKKFLHISLAHFESIDTAASIQKPNDTGTKNANVEDDTKDGKINGEPIVKESVLEGKILNQLIHQIHPKRIPQTNFRIKRRVSFIKLASISLLFATISLAVIYLIFFNSWSDYVNSFSVGWIKEILLLTTSNGFRLISGVFCILAVTVLVYNLIKMQINKGFVKRLGTDKLEIEIFEKSDDSYFDKYLNEVLYLFDRSKADVIVFEDMDRYNVNRIFERLREVNTLINVQRCERAESKFIRKFIHFIDDIARKLIEIKPLKWFRNKAPSLRKKPKAESQPQKYKKSKNTYKPLRFFYLLKDDIFVSKDRTKFFDYIIPIIPVVDSSNSYEQFLKHLKVGGLLEKFDQRFLQGLSLYIDDMRILKNIYNEFVVYFNRLNITELDCNKMMAMITYKNLFPRDFSDLQVAQGFIYEILSLQKEQLIYITVSSLQSEREKLSKRIEWAKKEVLDTQQELDDAYAAKKSRLPKDYYGYNADVQKLKEQYNSELPIRKQGVQDKIDGNLPKLEAKLAQIDRDIVLTRTKSLKDIITRENIDRVFAVTHKNEIGEVNEFNEIRGSDYFALLKYLIRNGFIDETYTDYMTYFYDDSISANDKTFLRRITDRRGAEYSYGLKEPKKVIESSVLRQVEFEQEETLNYDLLECLLKNNAEPKYALYLKTLLAQMQASENFDFISKYYDTNKEVRNFVIKINELWAEFFSAAIGSKVLPDSQIRKFSIDTLYYSNDMLIKAVNIDDCLTEYISNSADYLAIEQPDIKKIVSGFSLIGVLFVSLDYDVSEKSLFDEVYRYSLYELNFKNIALMLRKEYLIDNENDIIHKNYTLIRKQGDSPLAVYVSENISSYIDVVLENCGDEIFDDEDIAIHLLNDANVNSSKKEQYISLLTTQMQDITKVTDTSLWEAMLTCGTVVFTENNFVNYFIKHELDSALVNYLNAATKDIDFSHISNRFNEDVAGQLFNAIVVCNALETPKYKKILTDLDYYFDNYEADEISDEKFKVLIGEKILRMDVDGLGYVREKYAKHVIAFIQQNLYKYLELQTVETFKLSEALQILMWDFADDKKTKFLSLTQEPISIISKRYSDNICAYLITHNHEPSDKVALYTNYSTYGRATQIVIETLALSEIKTITTQDMVLDDALLSVLFCSESVTREQKIMLFTMAIPRMNEDTCKNHFGELGLPDLKYIFTRGGSRRKYDISNEVTTIFDALKIHGWIYDFKEDEQNSEKYLITKNKPKGKALEFLD